MPDASHIIAQQPEHIQKYIAGEGRQCPYCDSFSIEGSERVEVDQDGCSQVVECNTCERTWKDQYTLTSVLENDDQ